MMEEFGLTSLDKLAKHILTQSEKGAREAIKALPEGEWHYEMPLDGYEKPLLLKCKLTIRGGKVVIDFHRLLARLALRHQFAAHLHARLFRLRPEGGDRAACAHNIGSLSVFDMITEPAR